MSLLDNREAVIYYLHVALAYEPREQIRVLFLDVSHRLIRDEVICHGSVASATIHPREIMRRALELGAMGWSWLTITRRVIQSSLVQLFRSLDQS